MELETQPALPAVAMWRIHILRIFYLLIVCVMGIFVWQQVLFESADWTATKVISKTMLASLALLCVFGLKYPLAMLPVMLMETLWKTTALLFVILPAWLGDRMTPDLYLLFSDCIGILIVYPVMPWTYVWARYFRHPGEPWRKPRAA